MRPLSYPSTQVFLIAFSIVNPSSLSNVFEKWYQELKTQTSIDITTIPIILVGTKVDLREDENTLQKLMDAGGGKPCTMAQGHEMKNKIGAAGYLECSAKSQMGIKEVFDQAIRAVLEKGAGGDDAGGGGGGCCTIA